MANATSIIPFSASTQGEPIKIVATSTPGTLLHTTLTSATTVDRVWLWAFNSHTADLLLTVEFGGATAPDQNIVLTIPFKAGLVLVVPGLPLLGNGSVSLTVKAFAGTTNLITCSGYILRVVP
jgi:energy-converting hydrogenase Eha subunit H